MAAARPLTNLQVTLRGHKYEISDVETVQELQEALQKSSGVDPKQQGRVLFGGKRLSGTDSLEIVGVTSGSSLNLVPGKPKSTSTSNTNKPGSVIASPKPLATAVDNKAASSTGTTDSDMGVEMSQMDSFLKTIGAGNMPEKPPDMAESMEMMAEMMNSPLFQEYMSDPEKLEQSRQMILQNPLLKSMMAGMPGMQEILENPVAWREAMQAAANLYKSMDSEDLMKAIMGEGGPPGAGLFDGLDTTPMAALDELSEGED
jgi:hypothetical protein